MPAFDSLQEFGGQQFPVIDDAHASGSGGIQPNNDNLIVHLKFAVISGKILVESMGK